MNLHLGDQPKSALIEEYASCKVVYSEQDGEFTKKSAQSFNDFVNGKAENFSSLVEKKSFTKAANELTVKIGNASDLSDEIFYGEGYAIDIDCGVINVVGSSPQTTYYAVRKLIKDVLLNNADMLGNISSRVRYEEKYQASVEEYVNDISTLKQAWEADYNPYPFFQNFEEKTISFPMKGGRVMVIAHRGDMEYYPENSLEGIISAVKKGADAVEIDCARTKDGIWVLNHGNDLAPNTDYSVKNGQIIDGVSLPTSRYIYDWTYEQLTKLNLRFGNGRYSNNNSEISPYKVAKLEDVLKVVKNKCFVVLDQLYRDLSSENLGQLPNSSLGENNPYWNEIHSLITKTGSHSSILFGYLGLTKAQIESLREQLQVECGKTLISIFDREDRHNSVVSWYGEFDCEDFTALYNSFLTEGVFQGGAQTPAGTYIMVNRLEEGLKFAYERLQLQ